MQIFRSRFTGAQIDEAIGKALALDNIQVEVETLADGEPATVEIEASASGYLFRFGIPIGPTGPQGITGDTGPQGVAGPQGEPGDDLYERLKDIGYSGTKQEMLEALLVLLQSE